MSNENGEELPVLTVLYSKFCRMNSKFSEERGVVTTTYLLSQRNWVRMSEL